MLILKLPVNGVVDDFNLLMDIYMHVSYTEGISSKSNYLTLMFPVYYQLGWLSCYFAS